jgi:hypothetical protein
MASDPASLTTAREAFAYGRLLERLIADAA